MPVHGRAGGAVLLLLLATAEVCAGISIVSNFLIEGFDPDSDLGFAWQIVTQRVEKLLESKQPAEPATLPSAKTCGPRDSSSIHFPPDNVQQADDPVFIYLYADEGTWICGFPAVIAYSAMCQTDSNGRPVLGYINLCMARQQSAGFLESTLMHELLHILAFNPNLLSAVFPLTYRAHNSVGDIDKVQEWARQHYACDNMMASAFRYGFPLSDDGAHMRPDLVGNDVMVPCQSPSASTPSIISQGLAVILDSMEFYSVNYNLVDTQLFGLHQGCWFIPNSCCSPEALDDSEVVCTTACLDTWTGPCDDLALPLTQDAALRLSLHATPRRDPHSPPEWTARDSWVVFWMLLLALAVWWLWSSESTGPDFVALGAGVLAGGVVLLAVSTLEESAVLAGLLLLWVMLLCAAACILAPKRLYYSAGSL